MGLDIIGFKGQDKNKNFCPPLNHQKLCRLIFKSGLYIRQFYMDGYKLMDLAIHSLS
jgi:hypothetical protein